MERAVEDKAAIRQGKRLLTYIQIPPHHLIGHFAISFSRGSDMNRPLSLPQRGGR